MIITQLTNEELKKLISEAIEAGMKQVVKTDARYQPDDILDAAQAATELHISVHTVKKYARQGILKKAMPQVKGFRFHYKDILAFSNWYRK